MPSPPSRPLLRAVLRAVRRDVVLCVVAGLAWQAVAVSVPAVLERAVDEGIVGGDTSRLRWWAAVLAVLGIVRWVGDAGRHWWVERAGARAADWVRRRLVERVGQLDDDTAARFGHGDLAARAMSDTDTIWVWVAGIATLATAGSTFVAVLVLLATLHPVLAAVGLATVPVAGLLAARQVGVHGRAAAAAAGGRGDYAGAVESAISGVRTVKGLGAEAVVAERAAAASRSLADRVLALASVEARWLAAAAAIPAAGITAGLWFGGNLVLDGEVSVGALVAFAGWMGLLVDATETLTERLVTRGEVGAAAVRLAELLDEGPDRTGASGHGRAATTLAPSAAVGDCDLPAALDLAVDGGTARRGPRGVLRDVDLDVAAGAWLAVAGRSGAGKSTLLRVLAGLDRPLVGAVRLGGLDLAAADPVAVRRWVAYVPQGAAPTSGPVGAFLRLACPDATDAELWGAIDAAAATEVVAALGGLDGVIGDRGLTLSGGQRQRLAVAAAVVRRPRLLCLDDATSALDPATEADVLARLRAVLAGTTVVVATHRSAAAAVCDQAVLVADGGVVAASLERVAADLGRHHGEAASPGRATR